MSIRSILDDEAQPLKRLYLYLSHFAKRHEYPAQDRSRGTACPVAVEQDNYSRYPSANGSLRLTHEYFLLLPKVDSFKYLRGPISEASFV
eukprot:scaffold7852_cov151-Skeletonema_menzelii.AAC.6